MAAFDVNSLDDLQTLEAPAEQRAAEPPTERRIRSISDLRRISELNFDEIEYLDPFKLLPKGTIVALTGESGGGKSSFILWLVGLLNRQGTPVLYLDRENPGPAVVERFARFRVPHEVRYWGHWESDEPAQPGSPIVREWALSHESPLVIVDSAVAFMTGGDENDAAACRKWFGPLRALAGTGCTVVILHHVGKGESSKEYRGSSDFKAALDAGFLLTNWSPDGRLGTVRLNCWKSRFGFTGELSFQYRDGAFELDDTGSQPTETDEQRLTALLRQSPGVKVSDFQIKAASELGLSKGRSQSFLDRGRMSGAIKEHRVGRSGKALYLAEDEDPLAIAA